MGRDQGGSKKYRFSVRNSGQALLRLRMTKEALVELIKKILKTDFNLDFLLKLTPGELETLVVLIRDRVGQEENGYMRGNHFK
jgi:predicted ATPase